MYTLSDLLNAYKGIGRALVIYLPTAFERATQSGQTFELMIGTLGRELGSTGGVVIAYEGQEDEIASQVLNKPWSNKERAAIAQRPGLLIIDQNFADFDPRVHNFFHLNLHSLYNESGTLNERMASELLAAFHLVFLGETDLFHSLETKKIVLRRKLAAQSLRLEPNYHGLGISVPRFIKALRA